MERETVQGELWIGTSIYLLVVPVIDFQIVDRLTIASHIHAAWRSPAK